MRVMAELLGLNRLTVYSAIKRNEASFPIVRIGRRIVVPQAAFDRLLDGEGQTPAADASAGRPYRS